jgi:hypothetical protein
VVVIASPRYSLEAKNTINVQGAIRLGSGGDCKKLERYLRLSRDRDRGAIRLGSGGDCKSESPQTIGCNQAGKWW